jgi:hypothetical protein
MEECGVRYSIGWSTKTGIWRVVFFC